MNFDPSAAPAPSMPQPQYTAHGEYAAQPQYVQVPQMPPQYIRGLPPQGGKGLGITAMVLGIIGAVLFWVPGLDLILGVLATIFGAVGLFVAIKRGVTKGFAITGLTLGVVVVLFSLLWWVALATS